MDSAFLPPRLLTDADYQSDAAEQSPHRPGSWAADGSNGSHCPTT